MATTFIKPTFKEAFLFWLKLGFISFGGPVGQIAIMHDFLVEKKKWVSGSVFLHSLNYCMLLPGPEAQQLAIYIGWLLHGIKGGLAAGIFFVLPSVFILLTLSIVYVTYGTIPWVAALFYGLKPAVIAIVILALIKISRKSLSRAIHYIIALLSFIAIFFFHISFPLIILSMILFGIILSKFFPGQGDGENKKVEVNEYEYYINFLSNTGAFNTPWKNLVKQLSVYACLWMIPLTLFYFLSVDFNFWKTLTLFFTKAAFVTFGGAYAVLPYVAQISVDHFNWLSKLQMIDGLALGETTPGPLIMVLAFVGFMAGYNHFGSSILFGALGLLTTTFYTFLPCFFFIFAGAPIIESTQNNIKIKAVLNIVTAAVVGVILNLSIYLAEAVVFPKGISIPNIDYFCLTWIIISFFAMNRLKAGMITWIFISALAGLIHYFII